VLLAKLPNDRLEPTLLPLHGLGATPARGGRDYPTPHFVAMRRFQWLGRVVNLYYCGTLRLEFEGPRLEARSRSFELGEVHRFCI
jgi:hypothetical protein